LGAHQDNKGQVFFFLFAFVLFSYPLCCVLLLSLGHLKSWLKTLSAARQTGHTHIAP